MGLLTLFHQCFQPTELHFDSNCRKVHSEYHIFLLLETRSTYKSFHISHFVSDFEKLPPEPLKTFMVLFIPRKFHCLHKIC